MDGLLALAAAKKYADMSGGARYKTEFAWCPEINAQGLAMSTDHSLYDIFSDLSGSYDFIKGGNIYVGNLPIREMTADEMTALGELLSPMFQSTITVGYAIYITDADDCLNIFATDSTHESKTVLTYVEYNGGKVMLFADASATAKVNGYEDILLKRKIADNTTAATPIINELWSKTLFALSI